MTNTSVAFFGLGTMGAAMASNLLKAGLPLTVYNRTAAKARALESSGARFASTPAEAAKGADVIVSMLADDAASRAAWVGADGALQAAEPGAILVEASTLSPTWIADLAGRARSRKLELLDAPVTGSRTQAQAGQLSFLVGGSEVALAKASPVLRAMSKDIIHLGSVGAGATMKLINNFLCGVQVASLAEALAWIERSGLDRDKALSILKNGAPGSPLLSALSARMTTQDYSVNFLLKLMAKDLLYAHQAAAQTGIDLRTADTALDLFELAASSGYADQDMAAVVEPLRSSGRPAKAASRTES